LFLAELMQSYFVFFFPLFSHDRGSIPLDPADFGALLFPFFFFNPPQLGHD